MENIYVIRIDNYCYLFVIIGFFYGKFKCFFCQRRCEYLQDLEKLLENLDFYDNFDLFELFIVMVKILEVFNIYFLKILFIVVIFFNLIVI